MAKISIYRNTIQIKSSRRGAPSHASEQRNDVLRLLREARVRGQGLRKEDAIFQYRITQVAARVHELERMGYVIRHELEPGARFVTYFLVSEPEQEKPFPTYQPKGPDKRQQDFSASPDWFERQKNQPRPSSSPNAGDLPLFEGAKR
jgi:hypothetical protein